VGTADWLEDALEARAVGHLLGERVILIGTSHGALLAAWAATVPHVEPVAGVVMVSPNFRPADSRTEWLLLPWARQVLPLFFGSHRQWEPRNSGQAFFWNTRYPVAALFPMMAQVDALGPVVEKQLGFPVQVLFNREDRTVSVERMMEVVGRMDPRWVTLLEVPESTDSKRHTLAGDILSPESNAVVLSGILDWLRLLPAAKAAVPALSGVEPEVL
jgi:alpha-beta hydrolase superfamily lysophospholipase